MGRYVPRSGWAEQKTSRESCCGKTAIHHTCQPEFRRAKNCSFALRRLGQNREAKRVRRSLPVSRPLAESYCRVPLLKLIGCERDSRLLSYPLITARLFHSRCETALGGREKPISAALPGFQLTRIHAAPSMVSFGYARHP